MNNESALTELAGAILDGTAINWDAAGSGVAPADRTVVERLQGDSRDSRRAGQRHRTRGGPSDRSNGWDTVHLVTSTWRGFAPRSPGGAQTVAARAGFRHDAGDFDHPGRTPLARVRHPNVVTVYGAERIDGWVGLWMERSTGARFISS